MAQAGLRARRLFTLDDDFPPISGSVWPLTGPCHPRSSIPLRVSSGFSPDSLLSCSTRVGGIIEAYPRHVYRGKSASSFTFLWVIDAHVRDLLDRESGLEINRYHEEKISQ